MEGVLKYSMYFYSKTSLLALPQILKPPVLGKISNDYFQASRFSRKASRKEVYKSFTSYDSRLESVHLLDFQL